MTKFHIVLKYSMCSGEKLEHVIERSAINFIFSRREEVELLGDVL